MKIIEPGLVDECKNFLARFNIVNIKSFSKLKWKNIVKTKIIELNKSDLLSKMSTLNKLNNKLLSEEKYEMKPYFRELNVMEARLKFRIRSSMVPSVKMNFSSDKKFQQELWECQHCAYIDTQSHIISSCPAYEQLRINKNLENDKDLVQFFKEVLQMRDDNCK